VESLESQARHIAFLVGHRDPHELADAYLCLTRITPDGPGLDAVAKLGQMYRGLAERRGLEVTILNDRLGGNPWEDTLTLQISGAGAYALLQGETGLHQFSNRRTDRSGRRVVDRDVVRVDVLRVPPEEVAFAANELRVESQPLASAAGRLLVRPKLEVQMLHVPSLISVHAWTDSTRAQAIERLGPLLWARVEAARTAPPDRPPSSPGVIRRYILGPSPAVKDLRVGKTIGRLDRVLKGHLEPFLIDAQR
jgi:protein subunit release factor A